MTKEERQQLVQQATPEELLDWFTWYNERLAPLKPDEEMKFNFELIRKEIINRMKSLRRSSEEAKT